MEVFVVFMFFVGCVLGFVLVLWFFVNERVVVFRFYFYCDYSLISFRFGFLVFVVFLCGWVGVVFGDFDFLYIFRIFDFLGFESRNVL